ncbi:UNVERIFIED_CONTAM: hypothetical protein NCL1_44801 [Trichonephila clavipes]
MFSTSQLKNRLSYTDSTTKFITTRESSSIVRSFHLTSPLLPMAVRNRMTGFQACEPEPRVWFEVQARNRRHPKTVEWKDSPLKTPRKMIVSPPPSQISYSELMK